VSLIGVRNPLKPIEAGRWWMPGTAKGDDRAPPERLTIDSGFRCHNSNVYPARADRAYVGYIDGGYVLNISDKSCAKVISTFNPNPPFPGLTHTVLPLFSRELLLVAHECGLDWPKLTWVIDARREDNLVPLSTLPMPSFDEYRRKRGRFGCHNLHENPPRDTALTSETLIFSTLLNGGLRVHDLSDQLAPREVAAFVPSTPPGSRAPTSQINDVYVDENGIVYCVDRYVGGLYVLELDI
jgi:hypothetical protein